MTTKLTEDLAALWQRILRTDPKKLFGKHHKSIRDYNEDDWIAQPGYVGRLRWCSGLPGKPGSVLAPLRCAGNGGFRRNRQRDELQIRATDWQTVGRSNPSRASGCRILVGQCFRLLAQLRSDRTKIKTPRSKEVHADTAKTLRPPKADTN
jgi:hypothetical protein